jgi:hypothetical protein|tara:strand:- start:4 stop:282 length:279 start_codon:yes stop_codon:yes gene_type:complete
MAVGDAINVYLHTASTFQPASGVEIMVLAPFITDGSSYVGFTDGTASNTARQHIYHNYGGVGSTQRWVITNTDYYYVIAATAFFGFSGIQIK